MGEPADSGLSQQVKEAQLIEKLAKARAAAIAAVTPNLTATVSKDSVTAAGTTGLANVLAQLDAEFVADDLAVLALNCLERLEEPHRKDGIRVVVLDDVSALADIATRFLLSEQASQLTTQAQACLTALGAPPPALGAGPPGQGGTEEERLTAVAPALPALGDVAGQVITLVTQLLAGTYQVGGQAITPSDIGGLDVLVAQKMREQPAASGISIHVDRFEPPRRDAQILKDITRLAMIGAGLAAALPGAGAPGSQPHAQAVAASITSFLSAAMTAPQAGGPPPIAQAIHGEALEQPGTVIVYARVTAAGDDDVVGGQLWHDQWHHLTGVSVEYAFFRPGGDVLGTGVRTVLAAAQGSMHQGLTDFDRQRVYPPAVRPAQHEA